MLRIRAFQGLRPAEGKAAEVACVPYDVVNRAEAAALARGNPDSLLHVDRAEIDLPSATDPYSPEVYQQALKAFRALQDRGVLVRESQRCVYLYEQRMGGHSQIGVAAVCHLEDYERDIIKKHEKTRPDKEDDRTRLIDTLSADTGPVFLTYRNHAGIDGFVARTQQTEPLFDFTAEDGIEHRVWRVLASEELVQSFAEVPLAYVADGHHRTASAVRVGASRRQANPNHDGTDDYNWFLAVLFPSSQLQILPYNRCVRDLNGRTPADFLNEVRAHFKVDPNAPPVPGKAGEVHLYLEGRWYRLTWDALASSDPISRLDVTVLQDRLLAPILGIDDPRTSKRISFIGGIRGTRELEKLVNEGTAAVAFSMFPTSVNQLMEIADADQIMPPKSTWFEPKLRSGLFIHTF